MENKLSNIPIVNELCRMTDNMYRLGWDERNGGNVSILLYDGDILPYISRNYVGRTDKRVFHLGYDASPLAGRFILVTATGHYFRNISRTPESSLGYSVYPTTERVQNVSGASMMAVLQQVNSHHIS